MRTKREAKKILKAFGREEGRARIKYVESFLPEKISYVASISYRHTLRKMGLMILLVALILAFAVSTYAAVMHYLNYTKTVHSDNDEYISDSIQPNNYGAFEEDIDFYTPTYIPNRYVLKFEKYDEDFYEKEWQYIDGVGNVLRIKESPAGRGFQIDNESGKQKSEIISDTEVIMYTFEDEIIGVFQYEKTLVMIEGSISFDELKEIIKGVLPT